MGYIKRISPPREKERQEKEQARKTELARRFPAVWEFERHLEMLLFGARAVPEAFKKARNLKAARKWLRMANAADAKEFAQLAGKTVCLMEADIAEAMPAVPPKERGRGHKKNVSPEATFSKSTLSKMRGAYKPYSFKEIEALCDKAISQGKTPSRDLFKYGIDKKTKIEISRERMAQARTAKNDRLATAHSSKVKLYSHPIQGLATVVPPESVDLILTDPPYEKPGVPLYSELSKFAGRALKPGGSLLAMSGSAWLPEIMQRLKEDKRLNWHWLMVYDMASGMNRNFSRRVFPACKFILWLVKGKYSGPWINNRVQPPAPEGGTANKFHKWGQSVEGMLAILEKGFGFPGETVCDPFMGAGSTGIAAVRRKCDFIGSDIDPENVKITSNRIDAEC